VPGLHRADGSILQKRRRCVVILIAEQRFIRTLYARVSFDVGIFMGLRPTSPAPSQGRAQQPPAHLPMQRWYLPCYLAPSLRHGDAPTTRFRTHYVPCGMIKLKKEFSKLQQGRMTVNEYLNKFTQMSRYALGDANTDEKRQDAFLNRLNDEIQFQLLNTNYKNFQRMVDKAIIVEDKIKEMEKNGKRKMSFLGRYSGSNTRPRLPQLGPFFRNPSMARPSMQGQHPPFQIMRPNFQAQILNFQMQKTH
jgi:hypothetical protein